MAIISVPVVDKFDGISPVRHLASDSTATTAVEYTVMIALIVGALAVLGGFGAVVSNTFSDSFGKKLASATNMDQSKSAVESDQSDGDNPVDIGHDQQKNWIALPLAGILLVGLGFGYFRHRRGRNSIEMPDEQDMEDMTESERRCLFAKRQQILRVLSKNTEAILQSSIQVRHLMSRDPLTVKASTPVDELKQIMKKNKIRHLLVCGSGGKLVGVISDRDLRKRDAKTATELMTPDPVFTSPDESAGHIITLMMHRHISCVPVLEEGKLCGVLTSTDMMMSLHCTLQILSKLATDATVARRFENAS